MNKVNFIILKYRQIAKLYEPLNINTNNNYNKLWNELDAIFCINIEKRIDKYKTSLKIFNKYNIPVRYYKPNKDEDGNGSKGCYNSHLDIIQFSKEQGYKNILIFEDDIIIHSIKDHIVEEIIKFIKNKKFNILNLGPFFPPYILFNKRNSLKNYKYIYRGSSSCTHAYIINISLINKMYKNQFRNNEIDVFYTKLHNVFFLGVNTFQQSQSKGDILYKNDFTNLPFINDYILRKLINNYVIKIKILPSDLLFIILYLIIPVIIILKFGLKCMIYYIMTLILLIYIIIRKDIDE
jgi:GR25 family glycosyltransferase involved in LPS biosynthesis